MALPIADIEKKVFILWYKMNGRLKVMSNSSHTSRIIIKVYLFFQRRVLFL
jgi:hypothetical protein